MECPGQGRDIRSIIEIVVETQLQAGYTASPSGACFTSPFFLLAAILDPEKSRLAKNPERNTKVTGFADVSENRVKSCEALSYEIATGSPENDFRYVGEQLDGNSGFYFNRARWLDTKVGRFTSVDPFEGGARPLSLNKYLYAEASPAWLTDPTGLFGISEALTSIALYGILNSMARPAMSSLRYTIYFRLFAPWESFGPLNLYRGDNRSFSTSLTVPSKVNSNITVDVRGNRIYNQRAWSDESRMLGRTGYSSPSLSVTKGSSGNSLEATVAAAFPLHPAWDIDATMKISWKPQAAGNVCFDGSVVGDAFPNAEVFVKGGGKTTMIHTFQTSYNKQIGPPVHLSGKGGASMGSFGKCD